ncbi:MAG: hypothetical protein VX609_01690 [Verrucomicrobiota bacterium]|nr:hypothetical protein [Verrucomicrobiota bacterium]
MDKNLSRFVEILESYECLLHAETQAIASKEIDLVEEILLQKDDCMADLLRVKEMLPSDPRDKPSVDTLVDKVVELQQRNFSTFSTLVSEQKVKEQGSEPLSKNKTFNKVRNTYLRASDSRISHLWD